MNMKSSNYTTLNMPMRDKIITICDRVLNHAIEERSKVFVLRMDIRFPGAMAQDGILAFNKQLKALWKKEGLTPSYITVRERSSRDGIHYHEAWFLNGQKTWKTFERFREADIVLQKVIGPEYDAKGLIDHCDDGHRNGIMILRNDPDPTNLNEVQRQLSYLAKTAQKENVKGKTFFTSRIRKKL